ncbi:MAG: DUF2764 family protein [Bacteroidales bacterium]|nr:DUF2764 family protein [Bacteroidales bacterium]
MEYYSFIAGLPDLQPDDTKSVITLDTLKADIEESVSEADQKILNLFFLTFDNQNLCSLLFDKTSEWNSLGTLTKEEIEDFISYAKEGKIHQDTHLPPYFADFITAYQADTPIFAEMSWRDQLTTLYYLDALQSENEFIKSYFEFNLNLQNILSALAARQHGIDISKVIIGDTEVAENIKNNTSKDFGISAMFPFLEETLHIEESKSPLEKEQKIDALRWQWLEDQTVFHYFSKERIFAYMLKLEMVERWLKMEKTTGEAAFCEYVKDLIDSVEINITQ